MGPVGHGTHNVLGHTRLGPTRFFSVALMLIECGGAQRRTKYDETLVFQNCIKVLFVKDLLPVL